jgi:SAM-dependent methyltransferase
MRRSLLRQDFLRERLVPELEPDTVQYFDHIRRYLYAQQFVQGRMVLDIACGTGYGTDILRMGGAEYVLGMDISLEALNYAAARRGADGFCCGDATRLPVRSDSLDLVVSFETLEHLHEPERFLEEVARVLKPEGEFILSVPNRAVVSPGSLTPFSPYHAFEPTLSEFETLLISSGWQIEELRGISHSPRLEAVVSPNTAVQAYVRDEGVAWGAYLRLWFRKLLPPVLYEWQARVRAIPQFQIADSVLTEKALQESYYFLARCKRHV